MHSPIARRSTSSRSRLTTASTHPSITPLVRLPSIPTPSRIKLIPILISHLASTLAASVLPSLRKPLVQIAPDNPLVQLRAADVLQTIQRVLVRVVLDEAEAAGRLVEAVQPHDEALETADFGEELVDLLLGRVEGEVADVERGGGAEFFFEVRGGWAVGVGFVEVAFAFFVL